MRPVMVGFMHRMASIDVMPPPSSKVTVGLKEGLSVIAPRVCAVSPCPGAGGRLARAA
jgi:hypothetical protein